MTQWTVLVRRDINDSACFFYYIHISILSDFQSLSHSEFPLFYDINVVVVNITLFKYILVFDVLHRVKVVGDIPNTFFTYSLEDLYFFYETQSFQIYTLVSFISSSHESIDINYHYVNLTFCFEHVLWIVFISLFRV